MKGTFKYPQIYDDLIQLYKYYWGIHKPLPEAFRMTTGEIILKEIASCIRNAIVANSVNKQSIPEREKAAILLMDVKASLVVIRGLLTVGWHMSFISHGAFIAITITIDEIEKQVSKWYGWFLNFTSL